MQTDKQHRDSGDGLKSGIDTEIIEITLRRTETEGLGFNIRGGFDMPHMREDTGIFVTKIRENGAAALDGRLSEGDKILKINGQSMDNVSHSVAVTLFKQSGNVVNLKVLKDAERKIVEATSRKVMPKKQGSSKEAVVLGMSALILMGFAAYKYRYSFKSFFVKLFQPKSDKLYGIPYPSYNRQ